MIFKIMKREEEIEEAASEYTSDYFCCNGLDDVCCGFKDGDVLTLLVNPNVVFIYKEDESKQRLNRNGYYVCNTASNVIDIAMEDSSFFCGIVIKYVLQLKKKNNFSLIKWNYMV